MPIYAYRCAACGHAQDALQKMSDPLLTVCSACGEPALQKQVTAAGFQLKGSGWYVTDFRGDGKGKKAAEGDSAEKPAAPAADAPKPGAAAADKAAPSSAGTTPAPAPAPAAPAPAAPSPGSSEK